MDHGAAWSHERHGFLHAEKGRAHVEVQGPVEVLRRYLAQRGGLSHAGVGDKDVQLAVPFPHRAEQRFQILLARDVAAQRRHVATDLPNGVVERRLPAAGDDHTGTLRHEAPCDGQSDPAAAARHDGNLAFPTDS